MQINVGFSCLFFEGEPSTANLSCSFLCTITQVTQGDKKKVLSDYNTSNRLNMQMCQDRNLCENLHTLSESHRHHQTNITITDSVTYLLVLQNIAHPSTCFLSASVIVLARDLAEKIPSQPSLWSSGRKKLWN